MALINCKECGKEISDQASFCPNCGLPFSSSLTRKVKKSKYANMRKGFGITNFSLGLLMFTAVITSNGGVSENYSQMVSSLFQIINGLISLVGARNKNATIISIVLYAISIMFFITLSTTIIGFAMLAILNIIFITLVSISLSCKESFL